MSSPNPSIPLKVLVFASASLCRKAIGQALVECEKVEVQALCASTAAVRTKMDTPQLNAVVIDTSEIGHEEVERLMEAAKLREIAFVPFCAPSVPEEAARLVLDALNLLHPGICQRHLKTPDLTRSYARTKERPNIVAIGSSTGGPDALAALIPALGANFPCCVLIVQHMPAAFTPILATRLQKYSHLAVREAKDGDVLHPATVLIAPGDFHLEIAEDGESVRLHQGPPEHSCRPAVDVLFRSCARHMPHRCLAVVLTGMGRDGLAGAREIKRRGGEVLVQDQGSSVVWGMPGLVAREGIASEVLPLQDIAGRLKHHVGAGHRTTMEGVG